MQYLRDEVLSNISKYEKDIEELELDKTRLDKDIEKINSYIKRSKELLTIDEYIDSKAKSIALNEMNDRVNSELLHKSNLDNEIKTLKKRVEELNKDKKSLRKELSSSYKSKINQMEIILSNTNLNELEFLSFKKFNGSGIDKNKKFLAYYLTYFSLIEKYGIYNLPLCMDSFIKDEATTQSLTQMFSAIEKSLFTSNNQVFFSLVNENFKYLQHEEEYNIIDIGDKVLSEDKYNEVSQEIEKNQKL
ncbi:hypothetical protein GCM10028778_22620 [Barrientosiimonas marina]|uniref:Uncharacterized protein n=1 Tax=Lentibacillus kimchii TaxID=1542911 RepID=A0ABW2UWW9_9BACI